MKARYIIPLIAAVIAALAVVLVIQASQPAPRVLCNDGWTRGTIDGKIVETYLPENDTCKKEK